MTLGIVNRYNLSIFIDLNYIGIRSAYRFQDFSVLKETGPIFTGSIFGVLQLLENLITNYPLAKIYICDDGSIAERQKLFPGYKGSRRDPNKPPAAELSYWRNLKHELQHLIGGFPQVCMLKAKNAEADDLMAKLALLTVESGKDAVIFTSDKDLMQLMSAGVNMSKEVSDGDLVLLGPEYTICHKQLGVAPEYLPYFRPFKGDPSDDIPSAVSRVGTAILQELSKLWYESGQDEMTVTLMESLINKCTNNITDNTKKKLLECTEQLNLNFKLMNLLRWKNETLSGVVSIPLDYRVETAAYYALNKWIRFREGLAPNPCTPEALLSGS